MRRHFARIATLPWSEQRRSWEALALPFDFGWPRLRFERVNCGGLNALSVHPREPVAGDTTTLLYLHGGAYLFGTAAQYRDFLARLVRASGVNAIAIDYRLAPEYPFPAALEDAIAAYRALLESGVAPSQLVVAGDSAGGGLTASLLVAIRDLGLPLPARAALLCPWVDLGARGGSLEANSRYDVFSPELVASWARTVLAGADASDPRASPVHADLRGLPPLLVLVGGAEVVLDQNVAFAERARAAGVDVTLRVWDHCTHDWPVYAAVLARGRLAIEEIGGFLHGGRDGA